ncbi:hypothetical protein H0Z60_00295 [Ectothiorhodospiraceae bacterium WFHF3C12]|nr:hypothetical protein [Ectothiorhodospiraceae bacterium WFHF3C12]
MTLLCLGLAAPPALAQQRLRVFELQHRTAAEVKALVEPVMPDGVALSATGYKLIARGSEADLSELSGLIRDLDAATPDVVIETRRSRESNLDRRGAGIEGSVDDGEKRFRARVYTERDDDELERVQRARGQAGRPVYINRGLEVPVRDRSVWSGEESTGVQERTHYRAYRRGFYATATVSGERVRVEISVAGDEPGRGGAAERRRLVTTVNGRLGEWLLLGATQRQSRENDSGLTYSTREAESTGEQLWLRVRLAE